MPDDKEFLLPRKLGDKDILDISQYRLEERVIPENIAKSRWLQHVVANILDINVGEIPQDKAIALQKRMTRIANGLSSSVPLTCYGQDCPYFQQCDIRQVGLEDKLQVGSGCPLEEYLLSQHIIAYSIDYGIDDNSPFTERILVAELAQLDVLERRTTLLLSRADRATLEEYNVVGMTEEGEPVERKEIALAWQIKERIANRRSRIISDLVGTPKEKYRKDAAMGKKTEDDPAQKSARSRREFEEMHESGIFDVEPA